MGRFACLAALALAACRVLDEGHCANADGDATCSARAAGLEHCDRCVAENDGCVAAPPTTAECSVDGTDSTAVAGSTDDTTAVLDDTADDSGPASMTSTSSTTSTTSPEPTSDGGTTSSTSAESTSHDESEGTTDHLPTCGDGIVEGGEPCDGDVPEGLDCAGMPEYADGTLACDAMCELDTSACTPCLGGASPCGDDAQCCGESCSGLGLCL